MLKKIQLQNFKPFGENLLPVRLAPLTLIYGPNSSGKSSIIQALLLMSQTLRGQQPFVQNELIIRSELTNLGNFRSILHQHDSKRNLCIGFDFYPTFDPVNKNKSGKGRDPVSGISISYSADRLSEHEVLPCINQIDFRTMWNGTAFNFQLERRAPDSQPNYLDVSDTKTGRKVVIKKAAPKRFLNDKFRFDLGKNSDIDALFGYCTGERREIQEAKQEGSGLGGAIEFHPNKYTIQYLKTSRFWGAQLASGNSIQNFLPCYVTADDNLPSNFDRIGTLLRSFESRLHRTVGSLSYLGPLRTHPQRLYEFQGRPQASVGGRGEQAVQILYHDYSTAGGGTTLLDHINKVCGRFEIPYRFELSAIGDEITGDYVVLTLVDQRTQVKVAPTDVGFGIGQLLPILIEGLVASERGDSVRIVCVEQPEIHLHPRLQAAMADFFIETAAIGDKVNEKDQRGVQWILETHSEALILRIQRRIREGTLSPEDVSVLYVDSRASKGSVIEELRLDEKGEFMDLWPDGFFVESFNETLGSD